MDEVLHRSPVTFKSLAQEVLEQFSSISSSARHELNQISTNPSDVFANSLDSRTFPSGNATKNLVDGRRGLRQSLQSLLREPAVARVKVREGQKEVTYYICRATPPTGFKYLINHYAELGRLAELSPGEVFEWRGRLLQVTEKAELNPSFSQERWDSIDTVYVGSDSLALTIQSLLALCALRDSEIDEDVLSQLLNGSVNDSAVSVGRRRAVLTAIKLRDQAVLDSAQGEAFRMPLDSRVFMSGPPGTGKTTTLIRRLGQKLNTTYLFEEELRRIEDAAQSGSVAHGDSWLMFAPTNLLKEYVREAFNREGIPAPDVRLKTWNDYRKEIARNDLRILRSSTYRSGFILDIGKKVASPIAYTDPVSFFIAFDEWQRSAFKAALVRSAEVLATSPNSSAQKIGTRIRRLAGRTDIYTLNDLMEAIYRDESELRSIAEEIQERTELAFRGELNKLLNKNRDLLDQLASFLENIREVDDEADDEDITETDLEEDESDGENARSRAFRSYMRAARAAALEKAGKRGPQRDSKNSRILSFVGGLQIPEPELRELGKDISLQVHVRRLLLSVRVLLRTVPQRYRRFRRESQREGKWIDLDLSLDSSVDGLELDVMILSTLRVGQELLSRRSIRSATHERFWKPLASILAVLRNQILVDEATDFSALQLGCMAALCHPSTRSFFAAGDFEQRVTPDGVRTREEFEWVDPKIQFRSLTRIYRQSKALHAFSCSIQEAETVDSCGETPEALTENGPSPCLLEHASDPAVIAEWISRRIAEIEQDLEKVPSIAVFVPTEADVEPIAVELRNKLAEMSLNALACTRGQIRGQDNEVRVFDVAHVKGLEFEAAFFVAVDRLSEVHPETFHRYLYVGVTRAASFLGLTCDETLPAKLTHLRSQCTERWN